MAIILALVFVVAFVVAIGKNNEDIPSGNTSKKKPSSVDLFFGRSNSKKKAKDMLDDWSQRCDECGEYFEDCECNCDDEDCHNEGGW